MTIKYWLLLWYGSCTEIKEFKDATALNTFVSHMDTRGIVRYETISGFSLSKGEIT